MKSTTKLLILLSSPLLASAATCPGIHIFGARETTASAGFGSAGAFINMIIAKHSGATSEAIVYPACGGQSSCGGVAYGDSAKQGTAAVATAVNDFHTRCPDSEIVLVGYSQASHFGHDQRHGADLREQGGQVMDNALCGGGDSGAGITDTSVPISASAVKMIKAAILMGDPRYVSGLAYGVGTCTAGGFDARASGFVCPSGNKVQLYCDAEDPYCCNGSDAAHHQEYVSLYGTKALAFVNGKLGSSSGSSSDSAATTTASGNTAQQTTPSSQESTSCSAQWGQCGGQGWTGATCCSAGTCQAINAYYSQCRN